MEQQKPKLAEPEPQGGWTTPDAYLGAMARKRSFRRAREPKRRTQPESPRLLLSTLPFLALMALLGVLVVGIAIIAFPGAQPAPRKVEVAARQQGVAERGWFQEAQKQFHK